MGRVNFNLRLSQLIAEIPITPLITDSVTHGPVIRLLSRCSLRPWVLDGSHLADGFEADHQGQLCMYMGGALKISINSDNCERGLNAWCAELPRQKLLKIEKIIRICGWCLKTLIENGENCNCTGNCEIVRMVNDF